jgi:hypothetical protein
MMSDLERATVTNPAAGPACRHPGVVRNPDDEESVWYGAYNRYPAGSWSPPIVIGQTGNVQNGWTSYAA